MHNRAIRGQNVAW